MLRHPQSNRETYVVAVVADLHPVSLAQMVRALRLGMGRAPLLVNVPPGLIRTGLMMSRLSRYWDQLGGQLVVNPGTLVSAGWHPETAAGLAVMVTP